MTPSLSPLCFPRFRTCLTAGVRGLAVGILGCALAGAPLIAAVDDETTADPSLYTIRVGLSDRAFSDVNFNDATAAYGVFIKNLARARGYEANVETEVFSDPAAFRAALHRSTAILNICSISAWDYLLFDPPSHLIPSMVVMNGDQHGRRYVVLTRRSGGLDTLADLQGQTLNQLSTTMGGAPEVWLDTVLLEAGLPLPLGHFGSIKSVLRASNAILPVFFGKTGACLVDEPSFELMRELNPQVGKTLQVIARSDVYTDVIMCISEQSWPTPAHRTDLIESLPHLGEHPSGRQVLTLFKVTQLVPFTESDLATVRALRTRWLAIRESTQA